MEFDNINDALKHFGMGNLIGKNLYKAHGNTDNRNHLWLPKLYRNPDHINVIHVDNNKDYILQIDLNPTEGTPDTVPQHVFTRERSMNSKYEIEYIGVYQQVLYDSNRFFPFMSNYLSIQPIQCKKNLKGYTGITFFLHQQRKRRKKPMNYTKKQRKNHKRNSKRGIKLYPSYDTTFTATFIELCLFITFLIVFFIRDIIRKRKLKNGIKLLEQFLITFSYGKVKNSRMDAVVTNNNEVLQSKTSKLIN